MRRESPLVPLFPLPELRGAQPAVLRYLAYRRRAVTIVELSAELAIARGTVAAALVRLAGHEFVVRHSTRSGRWGRVSHSATPEGRAHARAVARATARIEPLTRHGLTRRAAEVLHALLIADGPLTIPQITAHYVISGNEAVRAVLRVLAGMGLCASVEIRTGNGHIAPAHYATDAARALTDHQQKGEQPVRRPEQGDSAIDVDHWDAVINEDTETTPADGEEPTQEE
ncbi:hypothetical protein AB0425_17250 [Actinosynnema sp. NPDC051121]